MLTRLETRVALWGSMAQSSFLRIGTRGSPLALWQAREVRARLAAAHRVEPEAIAITAIRTEDPAMMDFAFDALDDALPGERAGFYSEALALALAPGIAPAVRSRIEARHRKWT